jgi:hypothetical protein
MEDFVADDAEEAFETYVAARVAKRWRALDTNAKRGVLVPSSSNLDDDASISTGLVLWLLDRAGDREVLPTAKTVAVRWLDDPKSPPSWDGGDVALDIAAAHADEALFARLASEVEHPSVQENRAIALAALGGVSDPMLLRRALEMTLRLDLDLTPKELSQFLWRATGRKTRRVLFEWIASEWTRIRARWPTGSLWPVLRTVARACTDDERKKLEGVFSDLPVDRWDWLKERIREAVDCRDDRAWGTASTTRYLLGRAKHAR